jgi:hypothetical protein
MSDERDSDLTSVGEIWGQQRKAWPPETAMPWVEFVRRKIPPGAKVLREALRPRTSYLEPVFRNDRWREFYEWARSYALGDGSRGPLPGVCPVCNGHRHVQTRKRQVIACPRWDAARGECWKREAAPWAT